ncbi:MAG: DNA methylase [Pirellulales bacterium]|nr:DNA methylase [Pirellulales bacterium]
MHNAWIRSVAGRMKSDYQYSNAIVYNNFPWPQEVSDAKQQAVEEAAQAVLDGREAHPEATLADLYDPLAMPANLAKAHAKLDRAVDRCYRSQPFVSERNRVEFLFNLYQQLTAPLLAATLRRRRTRGGAGDGS